MLVLFDNGTPRTLARYLIEHHAVTEARARGCKVVEPSDVFRGVLAAQFESLTGKQFPATVWDDVLANEP